MSRSPSSSRPALTAKLARIDRNIAPSSSKPASCRVGLRPAPLAHRAVRRDRAPAARRVAPSDRDPRDRVFCALRRARDVAERLETRAFVRRELAPRVERTRRGAARGEPAVEVARDVGLLRDEVVRARADRRAGRTTRASAPARSASARRARRRARSSRSRSGSRASRSRRVPEPLRPRTTACRSRPLVSGNGAAPTLASSVGAMSASRTTSGTIGAAAKARPVPDHRNALGSLVERIGVGGLAVLAERLAVVRGHDDERAGRVEALGERVEQPRELRVDVGDLAVVEPARKAEREARGRVVGRVRIVDVHPSEEAIGRLRAATRGTRRRPRRRDARRSRPRPCRCAGRRCWSS